MIDMSQSFECFNAPDKGDALEVSRKLEQLWEEVRPRDRSRPLSEKLSALSGMARDSTRTMTTPGPQTHAEKSESTANLTLELSAEGVRTGTFWLDSTRVSSARCATGFRALSGRQFLKAHPELILDSSFRVGSAQRGKGGKVMWKGAESEELQRLRFERDNPVSHHNASCSTLGKSD